MTARSDPSDATTDTVATAQARRGRVAAARPIMKILYIRRGDTEREHAAARHPRPARRLRRCRRTPRHLAVRHDRQPAVRLWCAVQILPVLVGGRRRRAGRCRPRTRCRRWPGSRKRFRTRDLLLSGSGRRDALVAELDPLLDALVGLYSAVQRRTGCSVIVDSSKNPAFGHLVAPVAAARRPVRASGARRAGGRALARQAQRVRTGAAPAPQEGMAERVGLVVPQSRRRRQAPRSTRAATALRGLCGPARRRALAALRARRRTARRRLRHRLALGWRWRSGRTRCSGIRTGSATGPTHLERDDAMATQHEEEHRTRHPDRNAAAAAPLRVPRGREDQREPVRRHRHRGQDRGAEALEFGGVGGRDDCRQSLVNVFGQPRQRDTPDRAAPASADSPGPRHRGAHVDDRGEPLRGGSSPAADGAAPDRRRREQRPTPAGAPAVGDDRRERRDPAARRGLGPTATPRTGWSPAGRRAGRLSLFRSAFPTRCASAHPAQKRACQS